MPEPQTAPTRRVRMRGAGLGLLLGGAALLAAACQAASSTSTLADPLTGRANPQTTYSFLSSPDFLNADVGDVSALGGYQPGLPNSTSASIEAAMSNVMGHWQAEGVRDLFVAGDIAEGHWGRDTAGTGIFGPVDTEAEKRAAVGRAADFYYSQWLRRFTEHGITPYPALGDHDIGDNNWGGRRQTYNAFKLRNTAIFKHAFARNLLQRPDGSALFPDHPATGPARETAYAVRPDPEVQLITLDVFEHTRSDINMQVDPAQLAWVEGVLKKAVADGVDWIIVQGHVPIVTPVPSVGSSELMYRGGRTSALWHLMAKYHTDLYLCGEVHSVSMHHADGITQVCHGGLLVYGMSNYIRGDISGDQLTITSKRFHGVPDKSVILWQTDGHKHLPAQVTYQPEPTVAGTLVLTSDNRVTNATGQLREYTP